MTNDFNEQSSQNKILSFEENTKDEAHWIERRRQGAAIFANARGDIFEGNGFTVTKVWSAPKKNSL
jgi:hypothetical protein